MSRSIKHHLSPARWEPNPQLIAAARGHASHHHLPASMVIGAALLEREKPAIIAQRLSACLASFGRQAQCTLSCLVAKLRRNRYSTRPSYARELMLLINRLNLKQYDG